MEKNFFSIIIPTTKIFDLLIKETLPSIERQSFQNFECIIVPDMSRKKAIDTLTNKFPWLTILPLRFEKKPDTKRNLISKKQFD